MYSDEDNPCFIDLFIFDFSKDVDAASFEKLLSLRAAMIDEMDSKPELKNWVNVPNLNAEDGSLLAAEISDIFNRYREQARDLGVGGRSSERSDGLTYAIDNFYDPSDGVLSYAFDDIFPTARLQFNGVEVSVPQRFQMLLAHCYGDIYELPRDINTHYEHVSKEQLADEKARAAILRQLNKE